MQFTPNSTSYSILLSRSLLPTIRHRLTHCSCFHHRWCCLPLPALPSTGASDATANSMLRGLLSSLSTLLSSSYYYFTVTHLFLLLALFCPLNRSALHGRSSTLTLSLASEALCQTKQNCEIILLMNKINQSTSYSKRFGSIIIMIASHAPGSPSW